MDKPISSLPDKNTGKKQFIAVLLILFFAFAGLLSSTWVLLSSSLKNVESTALKVRTEAVDKAEDDVEDFVDDTIDAMREARDVLEQGEESREAVLRGLLQKHTELEDVSLADGNLAEYIKINRR